MPRTGILKIKIYIFFLQACKVEPQIFESLTFWGQLTASWASDDYVHVNMSCSTWSEDSKKYWHISVALIEPEIWLFLSIRADFKFSTMEIGINWKIALKCAFFIDLNALKAKILHIYMLGMCPKSFCKKNFFLIFSVTFTVESTLRISNLCDLLVLSALGEYRADGKFLPD